VVQNARQRLRAPSDVAENLNFTCLCHASRLKTHNKHCLLSYAGRIGARQRLWAPLLPQDGPTRTTQAGRTAELQSDLDCKSTGFFPAERLANGPLQFRSLQESWTASAPSPHLYPLHVSDRCSRANPAKKGEDGGHQRRERRRRMPRQRRSPPSGGGHRWPLRATTAPTGSPHPRRARI
jgi:hypothetical protein